MTLYAGSSKHARDAFRVRAHRGQLRRVYRGIYTDDFERPLEVIVSENLLAIAAALLPDWQLSHSSAATQGALGGTLFMSGPGRSGRHLDLPGTRIIRLPALSAPEFDHISTPTEVVRDVDRSPEPLSLRVSTPLQTIFECLSTTRGYPQKTLPDTTIADLIGRLATSDRARAERFAVRNALRREYLRYQELSFEISATERLRVVEPDGADVYFYGWRIGSLTYLGGGEYRFAYDSEWRTPLSSELPLNEGKFSYEARRMPAFFENCLPEGWTESVVLASNKLSQGDLFGLFSTTRKYLSNLTLRPLGIPESELVYDAHVVRLDQQPRGPDGVLRLREEIGGVPQDPSLWRRTRDDGPLRLSGVQAKLPVSLAEEEGGLTIRLGNLRHACTHILKVPSHEFPGLIRNEWATMELARRVGLPVADVAMAEFQPEGAYEGRSLLVERYDIPDRRLLEALTAEAPLFLQEDACSLLLLRREDKYRTSMERVADALLSAGVDRTAEDGMRRFLQLVLFSWLIGNGDLHAKNVSILRRFRTGRPGEAPVLEGVHLAPFYDLVNTRLHLPNDEFALPVDGRQSNLQLRNFVALARRWDMPSAEVQRESRELAAAIARHLDPVLTRAGLTDELEERYRDIVRHNIEQLLP